MFFTVRFGGSAVLGTHSRVPERTRELEFLKQANCDLSHAKPPYRKRLLCKVFGPQLSPAARGFVARFSLSESSIGNRPRWRALDVWHDRLRFAHRAAASSSENST